MRVCVWFVYVELRIGIQQISWCFGNRKQPPDLWDFVVAGKEGEAGIIFILLINHIHLGNISEETVDFLIIIIISHKELNCDPSWQRT